MIGLPRSILAGSLLVLAGCGGQVAAPSAQVLSTDEAGYSTAKLVALQTQSDTAKRQIIYSASIEAETAEFDSFAGQLRDQLTALGGFVADFHEQRHSGDQRHGTWTVRVDASQFDALLAWLDETAHVLRKDVTSQDMTEEYIDLTARLSNKRNTEQRLAALLAERPGKLDEVLAMEREIDRVREEVERIEGRLRFIDERVALSTVQISVRTRVEYSPSQSPDFATQVAETWDQSLGNLLQLGSSIVLVIIGLVPWLPLLAVAAVCLFLLQRRVRRIITGLPPQPAAGQAGS